MRTGATGLPTATPSSGGCRCLLGGGRGARGEVSAPVSAFLGGLQDVLRCATSLGANVRSCGRGGVRVCDHHRVFYYSIFPNLLLSLHPDYVMVHQLWPQSPERTLILCDWFFHQEAFGRGDFNPDDAIQFWDMVNRQDWHVCELSQQGISSRAYEPGPYSARESIPAAWDEYYLRKMG